MWRLLILLCLIPLRAAPPRPRVTEIRIPVWMNSDSARSELSPADFQATLDGAPARVLDVKCPDDDLILLVVLDLSSAQTTIADPAKNVLTSEIRKLSAKSYVGLLRSQESLEVLLDPIVDRDAVATAIARQSPTGKAGLLSSIEAVGQIADAMLKKSSVRIAILYVTDADVANYREDFTNPVINSSDSHDLSRRFPEALVQEKIAKLQARLLMQQTPVFIASVAYRGDRVNEAYQNGLKQLAEATAGMAFFSRTTTEIEGVIDKCFAALTSHYSLKLALPERVSARPLIHLTISDGNDTLTYRTRVSLRER